MNVVARHVAGTATSPLSISDKLRLAAEALGAYARIRWWLNRVTLPVLVERTRAGSAAGGAGSGAVTVSLRLGRVVRRTLAPLPSDTRCLMRSLVLSSMLSRRGIAFRLIIGTRTIPEFAAHAWVEVDGRPVLPDGDGEYQRIVEI